jgi:hypothetical protein
VIRDHLRDGYSTVSWRGYNLRFEGAVFHGGDLTGAHPIGGNITFHGAHFLDETFHFNKVIIDGARVWFTGTHFDSGAISFSDAGIRSGLLDFTSAVVSNAAVSFDGFTKERGELNPDPPLILGSLACRDGRMPF